MSTLADIQLTQPILNLICNVIKANDSGGVIHDIGWADDGHLNDLDGYQGEAVINVVSEGECEI